MHTVEKILAAAADFRHQWTTRHHLTQQTGFHHSAMAVSKHTVTRVLLNNNSINNNKKRPHSFQNDNPYHHRQRLRVDKDSSATCICTVPFQLILKEAKIGIRIKISIELQRHVTADSSSAFSSVIQPIS